MSINLITAFKIIPWADVLTAAPAIVQGAEKLWDTLTRKSGQPRRGHDQTEEKNAVHPESLAAVEARVRSLEALAAELHKEVQLSSELIKSLAQQNVQLVQAVDILRIRTRLLLGFCGVLGLVAVACGLWFLSR